MSAASSFTPAWIVATTLMLGCGTGAPVPSEDSSIRVAPLVTFDDAGGRAALRRYPGASAMTRNGTYLVSDPAAGGLLSEFDSVGTFLRSVGASGSGPGEFQRILKVLVLADDSVLVVDDQLLRATVLAPDLTYVRSFTLPVPPYDVVEVQPNLIAVARAAPSPEGAVVLLERDGAVVRSLVPFDPSAGPPLPMLVAGGEAGIWSIKVAGDAVISRWDSAGAKAGSVTLSSDWVTPARGGAITPDTPPSSQVRAIWESPEGQLWVLASVADPEWTEGLGAPMSGEGGTTSFKLEDRDKVFDTVIEVYDARTGVLLSTRRLDEEFRSAPFTGVIGRMIEDAERGMRLELHRVVNAEKVTQ